MSVKINTLSSEDISIAARMGAPFLQSLYDSIRPKEMTVSSPTKDLEGIAAAHRRAAQRTSPGRSATSRSPATLPRPIRLPVTR